MVANEGFWYMLREKNITQIVARSLKNALSEAKRRRHKSDGSIERVVSNCKTKTLTKRFWQRQETQKSMERDDGYLDQ